MTKQNDLTLLELDLGPEGSNRIHDDGHVYKQIPLCSQSFDPEGKSCVVSGWGHLKAKGSSVPNKLQEVSVQVLHKATCGTWTETSCSLLGTLLPLALR